MKNPEMWLSSDTDSAYCEGKLYPKGTFEYAVVQQFERHGGGCLWVILALTMWVVVCGSLMSMHIRLKHIEQKLGMPSPGSISDIYRLLENNP